MCPTSNCAQVLDDSTDVHTRQLVDDKAAEWQERGVAVHVVRRTNRSGYKAGALKEVSTTFLQSAALLNTGPSLKPLLIHVAAALRLAL